MLLCEEEFALKKFLIALLACLLVVGMFSMAMADQGQQGTPDQVEGTDPGEGVFEGDNTEAACTHANTVSDVVFGSCTAPGTKKTICLDCGETLSSEVVPAQGHLLDPDRSRNRVEPTCSADGKAEFFCLRCQSWVEVTLSKDIGGHKYGDWICIKKETCTDMGEYKRICSLCGHVDVMYKDATGVHVFDMSAPTTRVSLRADCENAGYYEAYCTLCGLRFTGDNAKNATDGRKILYIPPKGHVWNGGIVTKDATCLEDGEIMYTCLNTADVSDKWGRSIYTGCSHTKTAVLDKTATEWNEKVNDKISKYHDLVRVVEVKAEGDKPGICWYYCSICKTKWETEVVYYASTGTTKPTAASSTTKPSSSSSSSGHSSKPSTGKKGVTIPATNDTTSNLPYVLIAVAFVGLAAMIASKKRVHG